MYFRRMGGGGENTLFGLSRGPQPKKFSRAPFPRQTVQDHRWFRDRVLLHHQGSEDGDFLLFSLQELGSLT